MEDPKRHLNTILEELDGFSADPASLDYMDKVVYAPIYKSLDESALTAFSDLSGRVIHLNTDIHSLKRDVNEMVKVGNHYINAIQELGAYTAKSISGNVDYVVLSKDPEVMVSESPLVNYIWQTGPQEGSYIEWINEFKTNKDKYKEEIQDYYIKKYGEELESIKDASERRTTKKKNPLPPIRVIWEDQLYEFLLNQNTFNKDLLKWKMKLELIRGGDFDRMIPFIEDGKAVELSIKMKKGTQEEIDKALEYMDSCKSDLESIALVEKEPEVVGDNVIMRIRSRNQNKESHINSFVNESDAEKLNRATKVFAECVERVETYMDRTVDYNQPAIFNAVFKGKRIVGPEMYNKVTSFLESIKTWMVDHDMNYDISSSPDEIVEVIKKYYDEAVSKESGSVDLDGMSGVRAPIGIAVAYLNYASPFSEIEFEYAHDKWELRGDYSSEKLVCVSMNRYDEMGKVEFSANEEREM